MRLIFILGCIVLFLGACKKDEETAIVNPPPKPAPLPASTYTNAGVMVDFTAYDYDKKVVMNEGWYANFNKDSFSVSMLKYYISNVRLYRTDGAIFTENESYHLINHGKSKVSFNLNGVSSGEYNRVEFLVGIDSVRNSSGAQTGDLDPGLDMFWEWNSGYIFFKIEGLFNMPAARERNMYAMHIGGSEKFRCLQRISLPLQTAIYAGNATQSKLHLNVQLDEIFTTPYKLDFKTYYDSTANARNNQKVSDNYNDMYKVGSVEN
jgi:hypothetical protein